MEKVRGTTLHNLVRSFREAVRNAEWQSALDFARQIMPLAPRNRDVWESMAGLFLDNNCIVEGQKTIEFLEKHFSPQLGWLMLKTELAYLQDDWEKAISMGKQGLAANLSNAQKAVVYNCLAQIYTEINEEEKAVSYHKAASMLPDNPGALISYSNYLFYMHYCEYAQTEFVEAAKLYNTAFAHVVPYQHKQHKQHKKIRIGYLSADFHASVTAVFCYPFFKAYDRRNFEVYVYAKGEVDNISRDLAQYVDVWRNVDNLDSERTAAVVYADGVDILFDPSGHNKNNCLPVFAYKPAPVQISGLGYVDTTGLAAMDYFLTDEYVDPPGVNDRYFVEKLLRLPHSHFCYTYLSKPFTQELAPCLRKGYITFGTLNKFAKVTDKMLTLWSEILRKVPDACLYLKGSAFDHHLSRSVACKRLQAAGIDLKRVTLSGFDGHYMQAYNEIDIALDTYPYPGGTTTCDALYAGVPVVTLVGESHNQRFGYSLLKNMKMDECIAYNAAEYVDICVSLAKNKERLAGLRQFIARRWRMSPMMNMGMYMADVESAYRKVLGYKDAKLTEEDIIYWLEQGEIGAQRLCYMIRQELEEAVGTWRVRLLCYLADAARQARDVQLAYQSFGEAVKLWKELSEKEKNTFHPGWYSNMQAGLGKTALELGCYETAISAYTEQARMANSDKEKLSALSSVIMARHFIEDGTEKLTETQIEYAGRVNKFPSWPGKVSSKCSKTEKRKIRVGYISPDFRNHALFPCIYGLFAAYSKEDFTVIGYQLNEYADGFTDSLRACAAQWREVGNFTYRQIAEQIRADKIDILVDLAGHSANSGLPVLAYRPAGIQISGLGSLCHTGIEAVDYFITDCVVDPQENWSQTVTTNEKPLYLPSHFSYAGRSDLSASTGAPCLEQGFLQFGVFQRYSKINEEMLVLWQQILTLVPNSRLLIKNLDFVSDTVTLMAYEKWQKMGLPMDRIDLEVGDADYMERMLTIDIMLDTYPYTGGRTTMDALYMGVPVITRYGKRRNTRFGLSILKNIGLGELAVADSAEYVKRAVGLANDRELLDVLHKKLRGLVENSPLAPAKYMTYLENAYRQMVNHYEEA